MMETKLVYVILSICVLGCISRIILALYYKKLTNALHSMKSSRNRTICALKEQFILRYQAMLGVQSVDFFVGRFLSERKLFGVSLVLWNGLHTQLISGCLLLGAISSFYMVLQEQSTQAVLMALFQGVWTSTVLLFVDGICMIPGRINGVRDGLCDYLENYFKVRLEHEYEIWGKNSEDNKQTKPVLDAQLLVADTKDYYKKRRQEERQKRATVALEQRQKKHTEQIQRKMQNKIEKENKKKEKLLVKQQKEREKFSRHYSGGLEAPSYDAAKKKEGKARIRKETELLKQEVEERRRREAEAAASKEQLSIEEEKREEGIRTEQEQVNELLKEFLFR